MKDIAKTANTLSTPVEVVAKLRAPIFFGSEKPADFEALRAALLSELAPRTAYEATLAESLVRYTWEMMRMQRFRDHALQSWYQRIALSLIQQACEGAILTREATEEERLLALDLTNPDDETRRDAEREFMEITKEDAHDVLATAYGRSTDVSTIERRLSELEKRRKDLREEYCRLTSMRPQVIEDAEIVEADDGK